MNFNKAQEAAIFSESPFVVISAGAGSGKTRVLTERFIYLCEQKFKNPNHNLGATVEEIVAITFTEKAAREMKDRIRKRISEKMDEAVTTKENSFWKEQKELLDRAHISTFHSFCQQLLGQYAMSAGLPPRVRVIDEVQAKQLKRETLKRLFNQASFVKKAEPFFSYMTRTQLNSYLEDIYDEIRELLAGENVIATLNAEMMLDIQITEKEAQKNKLIQQFHEQACRCAQQFPPVDMLTKAQSSHVERLSTAFSLDYSFDDNESYFRHISEVMPKRSDKKWAEQVPSLYELFEHHWKPLKETWKALGGTTAVDSQTVNLLTSFIELLQEFDHLYREQKDEYGFVDFSDLQQKAVALLNNEMIQQACQTQFRHMMIDEFQDTNRLQLDMLFRINPLYRFIVGDTKQSIYRFRGANVSLMNEMEQRAANADHAEAILMNKNYRTQAPIIKVVNQLFSHAMVDELTETYETVYAPLDAERKSEKEKEKEKKVELIIKSEEEDELDQFQLLANRLVTIIKKGEPRVVENEQWRAPQWKDVAILIPARTELLRLERALSSKGVPYTVYGGVGFYERQEIVGFITLLRWLNRPFEEVHLLALLRSPLFGLTLKDFAFIRQQCQEYQSFADVLCGGLTQMDRFPEQIVQACSKIQSWLARWVPLQVHQSLKARLYEVFEESGLQQSLLLQPNGMQKVKNVEKLIATIVADGANVYEEMVEQLDERILLGSKEGESETERINGDAVHIMTVHASKGLEFPIVFLPQLERSPQSDKGLIRFHPTQGIVFQIEEEAEMIGNKPTHLMTPGYAAVKEQANAEAREESKRLFYVAMTRARDYLIMLGEDRNAKHSWLELIRQAQAETSLSDECLEINEVEEQQVWETELQKYQPVQIIPRKEAVISLSVSEIMTFMKDPILYYERYILGISEQRLNEKGVGATSSIDFAKVGTIVHRACELRDYGFTEKMAIQDACSYIEEIENKSAYVTIVKNLMASYDEAKRKDLGKSLENEWSFTFRINGVEVIGEVDKIVEKDGKVHIIDFKTNRIQASGAELLQMYKPQLYLYKMAYEHIMGRSVSAMSLFVLRDQEQPLHSITYEPNEEKAVYQAIEQLHALRANSTTRTDYEMIKNNE
ncbi:UvrD-helicase domain-containing protein [Halalkalibacter urbisdiaboli]|uniref:UvrD-helicase domain-containing protein n=1 Tax=Halalkalibacter urbisdiaboli TaxID=1960589 RepID=UPI000B44CD4C|nr:UvrD-helicase domain-containing protein [Halalkalibacter urbisdiaboli]